MVFGQISFVLPKKKVLVTQCFLSTQQQKINKWEGVHLVRSMGGTHSQDRNWQKFGVLSLGPVTLYFNTHLGTVTLAKITLKNVHRENDERTKNKKLGIKQCKMKMKLMSEEW